MDPVHLTTDCFHVYSLIAPADHRQKGYFMPHRFPIMLLVCAIVLAGCAAPVQPIAPPVAQSRATSAPTTNSAIIPSPAAAGSPPPSPIATDVASTPQISMIGALKLDPANTQAHADLAAYNDLVFVGKQVRRCPPVGVDIIDISDPTQPTRLASTPPLPDTATEDMQALRIGERDVLVIGLQPCGQNGQQGIDLIDITDPRQPQRLAIFPAPGGVHEMSVTVTPDGQALALLAVPFIEARSEGTERAGDLLIVDISDPAAPTQLSEWGVLDAPELGSEFFANSQGGAMPITLLHSVRAGADGTMLYLSYWDAGVILLDISDPTAPRYVGRTQYAPIDEGNAHSVAISDDAALLALADEDFDLDKIVLRSSAFAGEFSVGEVPFATSISDLQGQMLTGELVEIGQACPNDDLPDLGGKIALIALGTCQWNGKIAWAQEAGAIGAILYGPVIGGGDRMLAEGGDAVLLPGNRSVTIAIPALLVTPAVGEALRDGSSPVTIEAGIEFRGWGGLRLFDLSDPANPQQIGSFATPNARQPEAERGEIYTAHNPELAGDTLYASWYSDGVQAIDISDPASPRSLAAWTGEDRPDDAPPVLIWSVIPHNDLLLASDMNYGLYVLQLDR